VVPRLGEDAAAQRKCGHPTRVRPDSISRMIRQPIALPPARLDQLRDLRDLLLPPKPPGPTRHFPLVTNAVTAGYRPGDATAGMSRGTGRATIDLGALRVEVENGPAPFTGAWHHYPDDHEDRPTRTSGDPILVLFAAFIQQGGR
jgi:hypothetical protein